jgi:hypothetical protein
MTSTDKTEHTTETPSDDGAISSTTNPVCVWSTAWEVPLEAFSEINVGNYK